MLSYESIIEEAERCGMPTSKVRGIIREYLQVLMLKYLYRSRWQDKFFFLGGTSLRLLYNSRRFSEDIDFNVRGIKKREFEDAVRFIARELKREGLKCDIQFSHTHPLLISEFIFVDIQDLYGMVDKRGEIVIKFEANKPQYELETEAGVINNFGELFLINAVSKGSLFADKIDTLRNKKRGRHVYDIIFMLSKRFPVNRTLLRINGIEEEPGAAILRIINDIPNSQLEEMADEIAPFLFDDAESGLIRTAKIVVGNLVERI